MTNGDRMRERGGCASGGKWGKGTRVGVHAARTGDVREDAVYTVSE